MHKKNNQINQIILFSGKFEDEIIEAAKQSPGKPIFIDVIKILSRKPIIKIDAFVF